MKILSMKCDKKSKIPIKILFKYGQGILCEHFRRKPFQCEEVKMK